MAQKPLKIVRLLEPEICLDCRFSSMATVEDQDGRTSRLIYCRRLDCDNWELESAELAKSIVLDEAGEVEEE